jgi:hypothetical protein
MSSLDETVPWQERATKKRQECANKIPHEWKLSEQFLAEFKAPLSENKNNLIRAQAIRKAGILTEQELNITEEYTVTSLISALADGSLTSAEVTLAYSKRAALAQQLVGDPDCIYHRIEYSFCSRYHVSQKLCSIRRRSAPSILTTYVRRANWQDRFMVFLSVSRTISTIREKNQPLEWSRFWMKRQHPIHPLSISY